MAEQKRQHYVPQFYMKKFSNEKGGVSVYNFKSGKIINKVPYSNQCYKDYFYGEDCKWEKQLGIKESRWATALEKAKNQEILDTNDVKLIKEFALYQRERTYAETEYHKAEQLEVYIEVEKMRCEHSNETYNSDFAEKCKERVEQEIVPITYLENARKIQPLIEDLGVIVINYETKNELIISDVPIITINPFQCHSIGFGCMGIVLFFPISRYQLLVLYDKKMYTQNVGNLYVISRDEQEVRDLNILQYISAEKILIAYRNDELDEVICSDIAKKERENCREVKKVNALGSPDQKMMAFSMRKTIHNCELSFAHLNHTVRKIPFTCREAVPRIYQREWEDKLKQKETILPEVARIQNIDLDLSIKEIKRGCEKMTTFAKVYWSK